MDVSHGGFCSTRNDIHEWQNNKKKTQENNCLAECNLYSAKKILTTRTKTTFFYLRVQAL